MTNKLVGLMSSDNENINILNNSNTSNNVNNSEAKNENVNTNTNEDHKSYGFYFNHKTNNCDNESSVGGGGGKSFDKSSFELSKIKESLVSTKNESILNTFLNSNKKHDDLDSLSTFKRSLKTSSLKEISYDLSNINKLLSNKLSKSPSSTSTSSSFSSSSLQISSNSSEPIDFELNLDNKKKSKKLIKYKKSNTTHIGAPTENNFGLQLANTTSTFAEHLNSLSPIKKLSKSSFNLIAQFQQQKQQSSNKKTSKNRLNKSDSSFNEFNLEQPTMLQNNNNKASAIESSTAATTNNNINKNDFVVKVIHSNGCYNSAKKKIKESELAKNEINNNNNKSNLDKENASNRLVKQVSESSSISLPTVGQNEIINGNENGNAEATLDYFIDIDDSSHEEIQRLKNENYYLKNLVNKLKEFKANDLDDKNTNSPNEQSKEFKLSQQIYLLQEELIRVRFELEQSHTIRKIDHEKMMNLQNRLKLVESGFRPKTDVDAHADLLNQITKLQASENMLQKSLDAERYKVQTLNEKIFQLNQKLYETELNDSLDSPRLRKAVHIKIETKTTNTNDKPAESENSANRNDSLYYEIMEKLKPQGFNSESNYQDIIIHLYQQRAACAKQLNEFLFYMKQMKISTDNPLSGIKKLFAEMKSYQNEISFLKQKIESMKLEMKLQEDGYSKQIAVLLENISKLSEASKSEKSISKDKKIDDSAIDEDSLTHTAPIYTSTAEFHMTKTVTVPSHDSSNTIYMTETDKVNDPFKAEEIRVKELEIEKEIKLRLEKEKQFELELNKCIEKEADLMKQIEDQKELIMKMQFENEELRRRQQEFLIERENERNRERERERDKEVDKERLREHINGLELELDKMRQREMNREEMNKEKFERLAEKEERERERLQREQYEKETQKLLEKLNEQLEQTKLEKTNIENQLYSIHNELKTYQNDNMALTNKYEQQVHYLNEQLQLFQSETLKTRHENNELKIMQTKNNNETSQLIDSYEEEITKLNKSLVKCKLEIENFKLENSKLLEKNEELIVNLNIRKNEINQKDSLFESEFENLNIQYGNVKMECDKYKAEFDKARKDYERCKLELDKSRIEFDKFKFEHEKLKHECQELKLRLQKTNEEFKDTINKYELEIMNLSKEYNKAKLEQQSIQLDYDLKCDEVGRLQKSINDLNALRENNYLIEQKLDAQTKINQAMQDKLAQLQADLNAKGYQTASSNEMSSYENIIDNLKFIIQEKFALKHSASQTELDELRFKIHDLQLKLSHEKLQYESLEIKFKLVDQDNQNLRSTLLSNTRKHNNTEKIVTKSRIDEINDLIEKAQKNAQTIIAANPSITNVLDLNLTSHDY